MESFTSVIWKGSIWAKKKIEERNGSKRCGSTHPTDGLSPICSQNSVHIFHQQCLQIISVYPVYAHKHTHKHTQFILNFQVCVFM